MQNIKKIYEINVQEPYFAYIKTGVKKVEGRLNKSKFKEMNIDDDIILNQEIRLEIINKTVYKSFREMIISEGVENVIPDVKSLDEAEAVYYKFFSREDEASFGVVGIEIRILK